MVSSSNTKSSSKSAKETKSKTAGVAAKPKPKPKPKAKPRPPSEEEKKKSEKDTKKDEPDPEPEPMKLFQEVSTHAAMEEAKKRLRRDNKRKRKLEDKRDMRRGVKKSRVSDLHEDEMFDLVVSRKCKQNIAIYRQKWIELIDLQEREDQKEVEGRLQNTNLQQLVHRGLAIIDLDIERVPKRRTWDDLPIYRLSGQLPAAKEYGSGGGHRFENGDLVLISEIDPLLEESCFEGVIVAVFSDNFLIGLRENSKRKFNMKRVRIDKGPNKITFERMVEALQHLTGPTFSGSEMLRNIICRLSPKYLPKDNLEEVNGKMVQKKQPGTKMITTEKHPEPFPQDEPFDIFDNKHFLSLQQRRLLNAKIDQFRVNPSQAEAILNCFEQRFSLIQGPPGTGKTTCSVKLIVMAVRVLKEVPILASAFSNVAVDQIMAGLVEHGIKVVRLGQPGKVTDCLENVTLQARMQLHKKWDLVEKEKEKLKTAELSILEKKHAKEDFSKLIKSVDQAKKTMRELEWQIRDWVLDEADVICATCIGSGSPLLKDRSFKLVLIDECTQATEPSTIIPICKAKGRVILIGDQHQLPPTIRADALRGSGLEMGLFDRMINQQEDEMGIESTMLRKQYRMHPLISKFPREEIYKGDLADGIDASIRPAPPGFPWGPEGPVAFIQTTTREGSTSGISKYNVGEADMIIDIIDNLLFGTNVERDADRQASARKILEDWTKARRKMKAMKKRDKMNTGADGSFDKAARLERTKAGLQEVREQMAQEKDKKADEGVQAERAVPQHWDEPATESLPWELPEGASILVGPDGAPVPGTPVLLGVNGKTLPPGTTVTIDKYGTARDVEGRPLPALPPIVVQGASRSKLMPCDIGIVTPYADQVRLLKRIYDRKGGRREGQKYEGLEIRSVDGYQGREKEVIIFSTVRSNAWGGIGFLKDRRRINVAITRARRGLIVAGDRKTLKNDPTWGNWLKFVDEHNIEVSVVDVYRFMNRKMPSTVGGETSKIEQRMRKEWEIKEKAIDEYRRTGTRLKRAGNQRSSDRSYGRGKGSNWQFNKRFDQTGYRRGYGGGYPRGGQYDYGYGGGHSRY